MAATIPSMAGRGMIGSTADWVRTRFLRQWRRRGLCRRLQPRRRRSDPDLTAVSGIYSFADVQSRASQQGANTLIDLGSGNTITLANVIVGNLVAGDFILNNVLPARPALTRSSEPLRPIPSLVSTATIACRAWEATIRWTAARDSTGRSTAMRQAPSRSTLQQARRPGPGSAPTS